MAKAGALEEKQKKRRKTSFTAVVDMVAAFTSLSFVTIPKAEELRLDWIVDRRASGLGREGTAWPAGERGQKSGAWVKCTEAGRFRLTILVVGNNPGHQVCRSFGGIPGLAGLGVDCGQHRVFWVGKAGANGSPHHADRDAPLKMMQGEMSRSMGRRGDEVLERDGWAGSRSLCRQLIFGV